MGTTVREMTRVEIGNHLIVLMGIYITYFGLCISTVTWLSSNTNILYPTRTPTRTGLSFANHDRLFSAFALCLVVAQLSDEN